jgi:hypothetical protein
MYSSSIKNVGLKSEIPSNNDPSATKKRLEKKTDFKLKDIKMTHTHSLNLKSVIILVMSSFGALMGMTP